MKRTYMDYAATTPVHPDVVKAMLPYFQDIFGNPSSVHSCGQDAKVAVEASRAKLAAFLGAKPEEIVFIGIEPENMNEGLELSDFIAKRIPAIIDLVLKELHTTA